MRSFISNAYASVMDPEVNALRRLPKVVRFQLMTALALMWSVVFAIWIGAVQIIGPSWAAHAILLVGVYFTADVFRRSYKRPVSYDMLFKDPKDGCARYDDVWGG